MDQVYDFESPAVIWPTIVFKVRMFDLRHLEHSTIIYEARRPLLRLAWNRQDPNYIAALAMDVSEVIILDVRVPCTPVAKLSNHRAAGLFFKARLNGEINFYF